jgi:argininosuccinate lyase
MKVLRKAFKQELDPLVSKFVNSIDADAHLIHSDIQGSKAHAQMLAHAHLIESDDAEAIVSGLNSLNAEYAEKELHLQEDFEDVHMNVEKQLENKIGLAASRLHTGRSRNDQVALDLRLYTAAKIESIKHAIANLQLALVTAAENNLEAVMPGYTHLQQAQPILFAHAMHAFCEMLQRDKLRFADCLERVQVSPLGAAALAGSSLPLNPEMTAELLEFKSNFENSLDAVSDRDFAVEFTSAACICATHLSQLAETLIIWASQEFGFIKFADNVTTASSLMPNKKNPDPVELIRGKTGSIAGDLVNLMMTLKALPLGYNRDLQETKPAVIHASQTLFDSLSVMAIVIDSMSVQEEKMLAAASDPFLSATDLVEYLVKKGVPFRKAHEAVSELLSYSREYLKAPDALSLNEFKQFASEFDSDVLALFNPKASVAAKQTPGSTSPVSVKNALTNTRRRLPN